MKVTAVIMAGGRGERFWPQSRTSRPKQFLSLTSDSKTMIQKTAERLLPLVSYKDIFVVTNASYVSLVEEQLPEVPKENILAEPMAKNTAPCVALAGAIINKKYGEDCIMLVLPSDHLIKYEQMYIDTLKNAISVAEEGSNLVTIGITPTYPETGYGYINFSSEGNAGFNSYKVNKFVEKPNLEKAKEYLESNTYLWNSGMFVWKVSSIMENFKKFLPEIHLGAENIGEAYGTSSFNNVLYNEFNGFKSESIDFGIMEKADKIYTIAGNFGWDDVGSWLALERINKTNEYGNYITGDVITIDTKNSTVVGGKKLIAMIGLEDVIVVDTDDAMLICSKSGTQDVKKVISNLKICNRNELL